MKCPKCQTENPEADKFCHECGAKILLTCPQCGAEVLAGDKFCRECGQRLKELAETQKKAPETEGERKYVTVLFSDLSGYTAMSERLDPEEVKEIMSRIFGEIAQVVTKYEGFIEKFIGDAVVALFGIPKGHEDDPVRAIRAAKGIHDLLEAMGPRIEERVGRSLSMHTGINTGLVVIGEVDVEKGTHGVSGETINLASRLSSLAKPGEILVGPDTYRQTGGYFTFESLEPARVKGKAEPIQVYKVLSPKERPITIHRLSGLRADLIGRKAEMDQLNEAVENLRGGKGRIFSICGDAGTGKSRLIEEFKSTLDLEEIQWLEAHAYAYAQNIPYFPLIDFLNGVFQIEEGDRPQQLKERIEAGIEDLAGKKEDVVPYVGTLYALNYPEMEDVSPELWKYRLQDAVQTILSALARRAPTVLYLEDLHWADPSFLELLRNALLQISQPAIVLCTYRSPFSLFTTHQLSGIGKIYRELRLQDLSPSEAQGMLQSLLKAETIPSDLRRFVQDKAEGNPFYLEELVNSLIDSEMLIRDNGNWKVAKPISEPDISSTIHGVIASRLDRLEKRTKRILQEASVIGRAFLYEILKTITDLKDHIDRCLSTLERLDLIRTRALQPDLEYVFKHALTQEVVYNGLLKKERRAIHEQVGLVMEQLFQNRLPEFYETLAFHFAQGQSPIKAVDYLVKSGEKSLERYAVEEAHQYYEKAFEILSAKAEKTKEEKVTLIDMLNSWGYAYFYLGDFKKFIHLLSSHKALAESLDDKARLGMFYAWVGIAFWVTGKMKDSHEYLSKALDLGEKSGNQKVIGYACTFLSWAFGALGLFEKGIAASQRAQEIAKLFPSDQYLSFKSLSGLAYVRWGMGELKSVLEASHAVVRYGQRNSNHRSLVMGHLMMAYGHFSMGDIPSTIESSQNAINAAKDPFYAQIPRGMLGAAYLMSGRLTEAEKELLEVMDFHDKFDIGATANYASMFLGVLRIAKGEINYGLRMIEEVRRVSLENQSKLQHILSEHLLGKVYLQIVKGEGSKSVSTLAKNIGFIIKEVPFASKKAEHYLKRAIELSKEVRAKGVLGQAYLDLGLLHKAKKRNEQAKECISEAINIFEQCGAEVYLRQAREALTSLE
jgi:class 3 adenylate cyclase/tetratricopeptide (TPR) repeat protein